MVYRACNFEVSDEEKQYCDELLEKVKKATSFDEVVEIMDDDYANDMSEEQLSYLFMTIEDSGIWASDDQLGDNTYHALKLLKARIEDSYGGYCILPER